MALHIIQKTASAPYFIYASFEQADNLLTADGELVEDDVGEFMRPEPATATTPQVCLVDPKPPAQAGPIADPDFPSALGRVIVTPDPIVCTEMIPPVYCDTPEKRLFYKNEFGDAPVNGNVCVNKRDNALPQYVKDANRDAHSVISAYLESQKPKIHSAPWLYYKLVNVQYYPYDKEVTTERPNGSLYTSQPPYTAKNPAPSNFYMANIVVETNRALQLFSGGLSPSISTDWNASGLSQHKNTMYGGKAYNSGGCLGCHGSQGQIPGTQPAGWKAGDFSVILARGRVRSPEGPLAPGVLPAVGGAQEMGLRNRNIME